jgi:hypothetical protein
LPEEIRHDIIAEFAKFAMTNRAIFCEKSLPVVDIFFGACTGNPQHQQPC